MLADDDDLQPRPENLEAMSNRNQKRNDKKSNDQAGRQRPMSIFPNEQVIVVSSSSSSDPHDVPSLTFPY